jgi:Domain of Unknown Function with PDB structure (DUF3857)/Domain of Unknown Function with PDB structure (DUF3858)
MHLSPGRTGALTNSHCAPFCFTGRILVSIRRIALFLAILFLSLTSFRLSTTQGDDWLPIDPADLKMTSEPKAPGAPAIYLYRQVDRKDTGRANSEFNYVRIKILTEEGRKYANIEIPYYKTQSSISGLRARTIHPDGTIVNFEGKTIDQMVYKTKSSKFLAKTFTMPDVQVGSIIEYHFYYDFEDGFVFNSQWILNEQLFTRKANFSLVPYSRFEVRWSWPSGLPPGTKPPAIDPMHVVRMTSENIPAFQEEDFMPPANELKMRVDFSYSESGFEENPDKFWKKYGKKTFGNVESFVNRRPAMERAVAEIVSPTDSQETKLRKIYARCQQLRNLSFESHKTAEEAKRDLKPNQNVEDLYRNGYGYGAEITWLFLALARAAGFDAYPVILSSRSEYFFNPARMNASELNSNVVLVKLDGKNLFFDPGAAFTPFGLLMWQEAGVSGRLLDKDGGSWVQTELSPSSASKIQHKANLKLTDEGALQGKVTMSFTGLEAMSRRRELVMQDDTARKKFLEEELKQFIPAAAEVDLTNTPDWKNSEAPLVAEFQVKVDGWVSGAGRKAILPVGIFSEAEKHTFEHADRTQPVYFPYQYMKEDDITVELPPGWQVTTVPPAEDMDAKAAQYTLKIENNKNTLHITRTLRSDLFMVPKDKYPALRQFFAVVRSCDEKQVVLQPGAAAAGN